MPTNVSFDKDERLYIQNESTFGTIPNSSGTATVANANAVRHVSCDLAALESDLVREDKTGDRTQTASIPGRYGASWRVSASLVSNGVAAVAPDWDPLFSATVCNSSVLTATGTATVSTCTPGANYQVTFGAAHGAATGDGIWIPPNAVGAPAGGFVVTVVSATVLGLVGCNSAVAITAGTIISRKSVAYPLGNLPTKSFSLYRFVTPASLRQEVAYGCVVDSFGVSAGGEEAAKFTANGVAKWKHDSMSHLSIADTEQKGGLTTFPVEPSAPVTNGAIIPAFMGYCAMNGVTFPKVRSWSINHTAGIGLPQEYIGTRYGNTPEAGDRGTTFDITLDDDDAAGSQLLYEAAQAKATFDGVYCLGNLSAGNTFLFFMRGMQLKMPTTESTGRKFSRKYSGMAHGSGIATLDELKMIIV